MRKVIKNKKKVLNVVFEALSNEHRREIVHALSLQPHSISKLAAMRSLSLPAIHKHITKLEEGGLISRKKIGRTHFLAIRRQSLRAAQDWLRQFHSYWGNDEETLENYQHYLESSKDS